MLMLSSPNTMRAVSLSQETVEMSPEGKEQEQEKVNVVSL